jgi:hypothetical protein
MFNLQKKSIILIICACIFLLLLIIVIIFLNKPKPKPKSCTPPCKLPDTCSTDGICTCVSTCGTKNCGTDNCGVANKCGTCTGQYTCSSDGICTKINTFVAVGEGSDTIAWSDDGKIWNKIAADSGFNTIGNFVASNGNVWVAGGGGPKNMIFSKDNARTWAPVNQPQNGGNKNNVNGLVWDGTNFIAIFKDGSSEDTMALWSKDGQNWNASTGDRVVVNTGAAVSLYALGCNEKICVALAWYDMIIYSEDNGKSWTNATGDTFSNDTMILGSFVAVNDNNYWVAISNNSNQTNILYSSNGKVWKTPIPSENIFIGINCQLYCVAHDNGSNWVVVCNLGIGYSRNNGETWKVAEGGDFTRDDSFSSVVYNGKIWVASGPYSILYSSDGINWTKSDTNISFIETHLCWNGTVWVSGGSGGYQSLRWSDDITKPWNSTADTVFKKVDGGNVGVVHDIACRYKV